MKAETIKAVETIAESITLQIKLWVYTMARNDKLKRDPDFFEDNPIWHDQEKRLEMMLSGAMSTFEALRPETYNEYRQIIKNYMQSGDLQEVTRALKDTIQKALETVEI